MRTSLMKYFIRSAPVALDFALSPHALTLAIFAFVSTTLDDFCVTILFILAVDPKKEWDEKCVDYLKICVGQTLGFTIIIMLSLLGLVLGLLIHPDYINLIGIVPVALGTYKLVEEMYLDGLCCCTPPPQLKDKDSDNGSVSTESNSTNQGEGASEHCESHETSPLVSESTSDQTTRSNSAGPRRRFKVPLLHPSDDANKLSVSELSGGESGFDSDTESVASVASVASHMLTKKTEEVKISCLYAITAALSFDLFCDPLVLDVLLNSLFLGADNITIYITLFATQEHDVVIAIIALFYLQLFLIMLLLIYCQKCFGEDVITCNYGRYFTPFALIGIGLYILYDSILWKWITHPENFNWNQ